MNEFSDLLFEISNKVKKIKGYKKQTFLGKYGLIKTHIEIDSTEGVKFFNKDMGLYTSIFTEQFDPINTEIKNYVTICLAEIIKDYIQKISKKAQKFLVVGLGNKNFVSDSLGPDVTNQILVTRHAIMQNPRALDTRLKNVCALSPSVLGLTGIESADIVSGVTEKIDFDVIILVDSIISKSYHYIGKCFQVSTCGFVPGSGVDNTRKKMDENTFKVPVISIGVPLVVSCASIIEEHTGNFANEVSDLIVTKKDIDLIEKNCAKVVATSINLAIHNKMTFDEIVDYMS